MRQQFYPCANAGGVSTAGWIRPILRRLVALIPTTIIAASLVLLLINIVPGNVAEMIIGTGGSRREMDAMAERLGLNKPLLERFVVWLSMLLTGDLGRSYITGQSVNELIGDRLPVTLSLTFLSMMIAAAIAVPAGIVSALKRNTKTDLAVSIASFAGISMPTFWLGLMMLLFFSIWLRILPSAGYVSFSQDPVGWLSHLIMPSTMLGLSLAAFLTRMVRSCMTEVMIEDYVVTARAKGLPERVVIYRHALKNAFIPVVTVLGFQFAGLFGGAIVAEKIFSLPGIGRLVLISVMNRDFVVLQGCTLVIVVVFLLTNLVVDMAYMILDPRVRIG